MGRTLHKLSALTVKAAATPGYYGDGGGLYLQVARGGTKSWVFRYKRNGRARELGLGALLTTPLAAARKKAEEMRLTLGAGLEPVATRDAARAAAASRMTFADCATAYIAAHKDGWSNPKHADQWTATLDTYANPVFGKADVSAVDTAMIVRALKPIWTEKTETASRLRGRIERVLAWATTADYRKGDNPARWRGHLDTLLPKPSKVKTVTHHPALPYAEIGAFMVKLAAEKGTAAHALRLAILTATRTNEVIGATWSEFDLKAKVWTIPAERMKAGKEHRVPLSAAALKIVKSSAPPAANPGAYIFPGAKKGQPLSNMAMLAVLKRMNRGDLTVHGFRSTFRDWSAEATAYPRELAEKALAHTIRSEAEAAYQRGDLLTKRAEMMQAWAKYCAKAPRS
ncbi:tyrosine-type recombinase/integrase [Luteimonas mephitis]|uniref:tyrosine-type recombinase/integrase n=1 Tax=Luteimonas mephitis TaxID=83615 RepID=UPI003A91585E